MGEKKGIFADAGKESRPRCCEGRSRKGSKLIVGGKRFEREKRRAGQGRNEAGKVTEKTNGKPSKGSSKFIAPRKRGATRPRHELKSN